jgi:antitoxin component YwqK of YwqJK toxin-antitoxin module
MLEGLLHGYWEWFRKDGSKLRSGFFDRGEQVGVWTTYDSNGKIVKITQMKPKKTASLRFSEKPSSGAT